MQLSHIVCVSVLAASLLSHREGGEGQADASKAVEGKSEEDEG